MDELIPWFHQALNTNVSGWRPVGSVDDTPGPPFAQGGIVCGPGTANDARLAFPVSRCMFEDMLRLVVLPDRSEDAAP